MGKRRIVLTEIGLGLFLILLCILVLVESLEIGPPIYDSLGSAALPRIVAVLVMCFSTAMITMAVLKLRRNNSEENQRQSFAPQPLLGAGFTGLCIIYVELMVYGLASFRVATIIFVVGSGALLGRLQLQSLLIAVLMALVLGFGGQYLFTNFFYLDLP